MFHDKSLVCRDCGNEFIFSAAEQAFFAEKGFTNEPGRCVQCRAERKRRNSNSRFEPRPTRELHAAVCAACGSATKVPFLPSGDRPVYCRDCYAQRRNRP